jgi:hypothetical protein
MLLVGLAQRMDVAIGGTAVVGVGAGLAELIASAGVMEIVPVKKRGTYVGILLLLYTPIMGSAFGISPRLNIDLMQPNYILSIRGGGGRGSQLSLPVSTLSSFSSFITLHLVQIQRGLQGWKSSSGSTLLADFCLSVVLPCSSWEFSGQDIRSTSLQTNPSNKSPWKSVPVITSLTVGGLLSIAFIVWERRTPYPIFPKSLFTEKVIDRSKCRADLTRSPQ